MLERLHNAKVTSDELKSFYAQRSAIEDEYARKLLNLSRKPLGSSEAGTLRMSFDVIRGEVESMGKAHQSIAQQMKTELEEPLAAFAGGMKERRKIVQGGIEKLLKTKMQQTANVNKTRDRYENDCLKIKGFLAQAHMVMGQEERKNKAKLEKTQIQLSETEREYEAAVKILEETTGRWNRDWKAACDVSIARPNPRRKLTRRQKFQDLEEERIDYTKSSLWTFANIASTVCVSDDASCEKVRLSLEDCDVEKDITNFIKEQGTGQEIPDPPKFINFCRGDADTASQTSEDENYSVAQFARTMNPAYRASSPQPSMFESHHDPNNPLARELLGKDTRPIPQDEINVTPRQPEPVQPVQTGRGIQPDPRLVQAQQQAHQQYQQNQVPHNDYPADGMTQFCRIGPPSERSTFPSPVRPSSRDSQSDYSNPTSFSSVEPPSGSASPGKPMMSPQPQAPEEMSVQKKKGFFQNSPFSRRKSRTEKEPPVLNPPTSRNTWGPTSKSNNENVSPTRPFGRGARGTTLQDPQEATPEPVDPRANFQLNIGNNVFDVASPDGKRETKAKDSPLEDLDPIAQALAELKGVTKQSSVRQSADRYHGLATPMPPGTPSIPGGAPTPLANVNVNAAKRGTPPPSYDQPPMSRLGAPQPAHTARQMQKTTEMYVNQKANMFNTGSTTRAQSRPGARSAAGQEPPRATSPAPPRATSPRPGMYAGQQQPQSPAQYHRSASPNPYAASSAGGRPRAQTAGQGQNPYGTPTGRGSYSSAREGSPNVQRAVSPQPGYTNTRPNSRAAPTSRAVSPQPQFRQSYDRPSSSRGSDMALQIAPGPGSDYGGSQRGRSGGAQQQRPQSSYYGGSGSDMGYNGAAPNQLSSRVRSKSVAEPRQYTRDGRMILHYCEFAFLI
jgi:hypothetical protein